MRWKLAAVAGWALVGFVALAGAARDGDRLSVRELSVVNDAGKAVVRLRAVDGRADVTLYDGAGRDRLSLTLLEGGAPAVVLSDDAGASRMSAGLTANGSPLLLLTDGPGDRQVKLMVGASGAGVTVRGPAGERRLP